MRAARRQRAARSSEIRARSSSAPQPAPQPQPFPHPRPGKNYEIELHSADELCGVHPLLEEYDDAEYAEDELRILRDLEYCLVAP